MTTRRYLTPAMNFDRSAIMQGAWARARAITKSLSEAPHPFRRTTTARAEFGQSLRDVWATAQSERALAIWAAEQQAGAIAEATRREALPEPVRAIEDGIATLIYAEHADSFTAASSAAVMAARAQLSALSSAA